MFDDSQQPTLHSGVVFADRYFIAGAQEDADFNDVPGIWSSSDGLTWEKADVPNLGEVYAMAANQAGLLVSTASSAAPWLTPNGRDWEPSHISQNPEDWVFAIGATPAGFVAFGSSAWTSSNGRDWQPVTTESALDLVTAGVVKVASYGDRLVALTGGRASGGPLVVWTSTNLVDWTRAGSLRGSRSVDDPTVAGGPLGWIVTGSFEERRRTDLMWWSADGLLWQEVSQPIGPVSDVFVDEAGYVAVGFLHIGEGCALDPRDIQGYTWTSVDGQSWTQMPLDGFLYRRIDHLFRDGRTLLGVGLTYEDEEQSTASGAVWTARLPPIPPAGPGPIVPELESPSGGCGPG